MVRPVFLSSARRSGPPDSGATANRPEPSPANRSVLVTRSATCWDFPVGATLTPFRAGWVLIHSGLSPFGPVHRRSPVFRSIAVIRPYGGFTIGTPCGPNMRGPAGTAAGFARAFGLGRAAPKPDT